MFSDPVEEYQEECQGRQCNNYSGCVGNGGRQGEPFGSKQKVCGSNGCHEYGREQCDPEKLPVLCKVYGYGPEHHCG